MQTPDISADSALESYNNTRIMRDEALELRERFDQFIKKLDLILNQDRGRGRE